MFSHPFKGHGLTPVIKISAEHLPKQTRLAILRLASALRHV